MKYLLIVTEDGYGKRVPLDDDLTRKHRGVHGAGIASRPVAVSCVVVDEIIDVGDGTITVDRHEDRDLVLATRNGIVNRIKVGSVPVRRRSHSTGGKRVVSRGVRIIKLDAGDRVATGAVTRDRVAESTQKPPLSLDGIRVSTDRLVFGPRRPLSAISTTGEPALDTEAWAATEIHKHSTYRCAHCGSEHPDPYAVYECIATHVERAATPPMAMAA
jgi:DNA gyrase/topoisomerase IV subunit A